MYQRPTYLVVTYSPTYLYIYTGLISYKMGYQVETRY